MSLSPRFSRAPHADASDRELRAALAAAARSTARFRYRSAVADPFGTAGALGGWEDVGLVDFPGQAAWYARAWVGPADRGRPGETIGVLGPAGLVTLRADGSVSEVPGALHLLNATSNPLGMLRLLDPAFATAAPAGGGRWRIQIDLGAARRVLGAAAIGPMLPLRPVLAATAQVQDGRLDVAALQVGVWGEPHAWAAVRLSDWGAALPPELIRDASPQSDFGRLREVLVGSERR